MSIDGIQSSGSDTFGNAKLSAFQKSIDATKAAAEEAEQSGDESKVEDVAEKFEALLSTMLVKEMRKALPEGVFGKGPGADVFEGWFDEHIGAEIARGGDGLDLAGVIKANLGLKSGEEQALQSFAPKNDSSEDA